MVAPLLLLRCGTVRVHSAVELLHEVLESYWSKLLLSVIVAAVVLAVIL